MSVARLFPAILIAFALPSSAEARGRYRYYLDKNRAEQVLAQVPWRTPLSEDRWREILGDRQGRSLTVQPGDNLWTLSARGFGDPFLWRKLWQVNPELTNPHELSVGRQLAYNSTTSSDWQIPLVRLVPSEKRAQDLESDAVVGVQYRDKFRTPVLVMNPEDFLGEITAAGSPREYLSLQDKIFIRGVNDHPTPTTGKFSVARVEGNFGGGKLMRLVGDVEVLDEHEGIAKIVFRQQGERISRGDKLIPVVPFLKALTLVNPPENMETRVLRGDIDDRTAFAQGQAILIDKGASDGVKPGFLFRAIEDEDPMTESGRGMLADFKAEVQIIHVDPETSVGMISKSQAPLVKGDRLLPAQLFLDPPAPPRLNRIELTLD